MINRLQSEWAAFGPPSFLLRLISAPRPANLAPMKTEIILITGCIITC